MYYVANMSGIPKLFIYFVVVLLLCYYVQLILIHSSIDIWGLGVLIWEVFNGPLSNQSALKIPKKVYSNILLKIY